MEHNFIIAGFGGQGVLLAGEVLANAFMLDDKKESDVYVAITDDGKNFFGCECLLNAYLGVWLCLKELFVFLKNYSI